MPVENLDDVRSFLSHMRSKVMRRVDGLLPEVQRWRSATGKWSALEYLEHLALSEQYFMLQLRLAVEQAEADGLLAAPAARRLVDASPVLQAAGAVGTPNQAPPELQPRGRMLSEIKEMMAKSRAQLMGVASRLDALDTDRVSVYHPVARASFNAAQFLHFIGTHEWLHDQHIQASVRAWEAAHEQRPTPKEHQSCPT